jgi:tetratricopeptide (TPR) repeat protein
LRLLGIAALRRGSYEEAAHYFERAVAIEKRPGPVTPTACDALQGMAEAYLNLDRAADAEEPVRRALTCREQLYGPEHPLVGGSFLLTGGVYYWLGRLDEAVVAWEKALEIYVRSETLSDPDHAVVLANLGRVYLKRGEIGKAEIAYVQLIGLHGRSIEPGDEDLGMAWADLGVVYFSSDRTARARGAFLNALRILEPQLGPEDPAVVQVRRNLAAAARRLRQRRPSP